MATYKKKSDFFETEEGIEVRKQLKAMVSDSSYVTRSSYSANTELYPDNLIPFVEKHMQYLRNNPSTNPKQYLSNLRLRTRIR